MCFHPVTLLLDQMDLIASLEGLKKLFVQFSLFFTCNMSNLVSELESPVGQR